MGQGNAPPKRIPPVSVAELQVAIDAGKLDPGIIKILPEEFKYIKQRRPTASTDDLAGLALSGGGIRSATFALGVMQALSETPVLKRMDYLSTVSGGGYIGSAITWFLGPQNEKDESGKDKFGLEKKNFPFGHDSGRDGTSTQRSMLDWLRQHGKYLTPGKGITLMSGIAVVLRGILLNLLVWIPLGIAAFLILFDLGDWIVARLTNGDGLVSWLLGFLGGLQAIIDTKMAKELVVAALGISALVLLILAAGSVLYSLITWICLSPGRARYAFRRWAEKISGAGMWIALVGVALASIPIVGVMYDSWVASVGGPLAALTGIITGIWGFLRTLRKESGGSLSIAAPIGAALLIYGIALICFWLVFRLESTSLPTLPPSWAWPAYWSFLAVAIGTGIFVNINYISIHLFYRDRLMETFLPNLKSALAGITGTAYAANSEKLNAVLKSQNPVAPYQLINANVVLVNSSVPRRRLRGGDSFILTPYYSGSSATGWISTASLIKGKFTLPTAMAISGAAANPNAGSDGVGLTRSRTISLLMSLLNLRLGYWVPNPQGGCRWIAPNHFIPEFGQAFGGRFGFHQEKACYVELSDGGHFENLGLYELVRRRLKLIILCDAAADPKFSFSDLNSLRRRIAADFGARIEFKSGPENLMPWRLKHMAPDNAGYAIAADMAETGFIRGKIIYSDKSTGVLVYIKTTMVDSLNFGVKAYKGAHHTFPDQSTADQFFDEEQFDAYRELGRHLGQKMLDDTGLASRLDDVIAKGDWA